MPEKILNLKLQMYRCHAKHHEWMQNIGAGETEYLLWTSRDSNVTTLRVYVSEYPYASCTSHWLCCELVPGFPTLRTAHSPKLLARVGMLGSEEMVHGCGLGDV